MSEPDKNLTEPANLHGWSWGAFLLNWIWAIGNRTWIGLLALIPVIGIVMAIVLGIKGRQWAWQNKRWKDVSHFNRVQRNWAIWGIACYIVAFWLFIAGIAMFYVMQLQREHPEFKNIFSHAPTSESEGNWSIVTREVYQFACAEGIRKNKNLVDQADYLCACVVDRAEKVIPEDDISDEQNISRMKEIMIDCINDMD